MVELFYSRVITVALEKEVQGPYNKKLFTPFWDHCGGASLSFPETHFLAIVVVVVVIIIIIIIIIIICVYLLIINYFRVHTAKFRSKQLQLEYGYCALLWWNTFSATSCLVKFILETFNLFNSNRFQDKFDEMRSGIECVSQTTRDRNYRVKTVE